MKNPRLHWDSVRGWIIDVPAALSAQQLARIADWAYPRQVDRWRSLPPGDRKDECARAVAALRDHQIQQRVVNDDGTVFASTAKTRPERTMFVVEKEN